MEQIKIPCVIMRAGTSKGVFMHAKDLPGDAEQRDRMIMALFGSPDVRQIDGLGGADPLTSKFAIIGPPTRPDADVDYTFVQVGIKTEILDFSGNCGNISAGVAPFAIDEGLVEVSGEVATVRIHNTNTGKIIVSEVLVVDGKAKVCGDYAIAGVPGVGAPIMLDFADTAGAATGSMLPTGKVIDTVEVEGIGEIEASIIDVANPMVFVRASDLGLSGTETPAEIDGDEILLRRLEEIRSKAAVMIGMAKTCEEATEKSPAFPMVAFISPPLDYVDFTTGKKIASDEVDFLSRMMFMQVTHKTYAGTASVCTAVAAKVPGTLVEKACASTTAEVRIGHPAGVLTVEAAAEKDAEGYSVTRAAFGRTARRLMDGNAYVMADCIKHQNS